MQGKAVRYQGTIRACFAGYVVQAIVNNFVPLLFLTFQGSYGIPLAQITLLITFNFGLQLLVDLASVAFVDRIGYRASAVLAHAFSFAGLVLLTVLPEVMPTPFAGILIAVTVYAIGGGLLEVLISPIVESCPSDNKEKAMSMLHSFYCWGSVAVVTLSNAYFAAFGASNWKPLALLWALVPLGNLFAFLRVPIAPLIAEGERGMTARELFQNGTFWLMLALMFASGACEQAVSQWASAFAEKGLGVSKAVGDLAGPAFFSVMMGSSRAFYGKFGDRIDLRRFMIVSGALCAASYLVLSLSPIPAVALLGCGLCGLSVGILWPGTFSMASAAIRRGGTAMFAFLALAGDLGCSGGPTLVGMVSSASGDRLQIGILAALVFPALLLICLLGRRKKA